MPDDRKLLAEWFWTDRWMGSSAFLLPIEPRGLYREMLTQAWRRCCRLPADHEAIRRAIGCTKAEWQRCWPKVERYWRLDGDALVNDTQLEIYTEAKTLKERATERGKKGALARAQVFAQAVPEQRSSSAQAQLERVLKDQPPSPSPSPSPNEDPRKERVSLPARTGGGAGAGTFPRDHLRHSWCGRVCVPDFLHEQFQRSTGQSEQALKAFYCSVFDSMSEHEPVEPDALKFWRPLVTKRWPPKAAGQSMHQDGTTVEDLAAAIREGRKRGLYDRR